MSAAVKNHIRSNVVGYIALFCFVVGGTAIASGDRDKKAKRNSVVSSSIASGAVKNKDLHADAVDGSKVADGSLSSADFDGDVGAGEAAGGDLAGTYPNPALRAGAVDGGAGGDIADGTITGDDVNPSSSVRLEQTIAGGSQSLDIDSGGLRGASIAGHAGSQWILNSGGLDVAAGPAVGFASYGPGRITFGESSAGPPAQSNEVVLFARDEGGGMELVAIFGDGTEVVLASEAP